MPLSSSSLQTLAKFNSQLVLNAHLREELETMRIEHSRFQQLCRRLERVRACPGGRRGGQKGLRPGSPSSGKGVGFGG